MCIFTALSDLCLSLKVEKFVRNGIFMHKIELIRRHALREYLIEMDLWKR